MTRRLDTGVTLLELLTVLAIIGLIASILFPTFHLVKRSAKGTRSVSNMRQISTALQIYALDYDSDEPYGVVTPPSLYTLVSTNLISMRILDTGSGIPNTAYMQVFPDLPAKDAVRLNTWRGMIEKSGGDPLVVADVTQEADIFHTEPPFGARFHGFATTYMGTLKKKYGTRTELLDVEAW